MPAAKTKPEPKGTAIVDNEAEIERAAQELDRLLDDPTSDGSAISAARGVLEHAQAQRARAERLDAEAAERARVARIDEIVSSLADGQLRQRAVDVLAAYDAARDSMRALHDVAKAHDNALADAHAELLKLKPLPDNIELPRELRGSRFNRTGPSSITIDGTTWRHDLARPDALITDLALTTCETERARRTLAPMRGHRDSDGAIESVARPLKTKDEA